MSNEVKQTFERRIDSLIGQIKSLKVKDDSDEIISNLSKYLCILIAGYTEKLFVYYINNYFAKKAHPKLVNWLYASLRLQMSKIEDILGKFDSSWCNILKENENYQEYKDSLQSIYDNRNKIAHGEISNIGIQSLESSYLRIQDFFECLLKIMNG